ncbi:hypothetical protein ANN_10666 [Periplaneta americana]|uniref:DDE-1 domain-containing protein n=1 Tax=Periplaneta americana TaxID=6978 RepID=A0ABQ8T570_PERAM|nr:hypothetical protein ANN_10666 [Periplaneta americana]
MGCSNYRPSRWCYLLEQIRVDEETEFDSVDSHCELLDRIMRGEMGYKKAADSFKVPQSTLERIVKLVKPQAGRPTAGDVQAVSDKDILYVEQPNLNLVQSLGPIKTVFSEILFGITTYDLRVLAYQWAEKLGKVHSFSKTKEIAGKDWLSGFSIRHPQLALRKPEATSAARAAAFNKVNVGKFFDLLTRVVEENGFTPEKIYNCDETGVTIMPKHRSNIFSLKGRKQVGVLTSAERGNTITIEVCFNAAGTYMAPTFIFPRVRANNQLMNNCPPGATAEYHPSGWMQSEIFFSWFKRFVMWSRATKDSPVLLLLEGHFTHTKTWL